MYLLPPYIIIQVRNRASSHMNVVPTVFAVIIVQRSQPVHTSVATIVSAVHSTQPSSYPTTLPRQRAISQTNKSSKFSNKLKIGKTVINWSKLVKYLGVMIDNKLNFAKHKSGHRQGERSPQTTLSRPQQGERNSNQNKNLYIQSIHQTYYAGQRTSPKPVCDV